MAIKINVQDIEINRLNCLEEDYLCMTDTAKAKNSGTSDGLIWNWLRNRNTIEFLGIWEQ